MRKITYFEICLFEICNDELKIVVVCLRKQLKTCVYIMAFLMMVEIDPILQIRGSEYCHHGDFDQLTFLNQSAYLVR